MTYFSRLSNRLFQGHFNSQNSLKPETGHFSSAHWKLGNCSFNSSEIGWCIGRLEKEQEGSYLDYNQSNLALHFPGLADVWCWLSSSWELSGLWRFPNEPSLCSSLWWGKSTSILSTPSGLLPQSLGIHHQTVAAGVSTLHWTALLVRSQDTLTHTLSPLWPTAGP